LKHAFEKAVYTYGIVAYRKGLKIKIIKNNAVRYYFFII